MGRHFYDLAGMRFGKLLVIGRVFVDGSVNTYFKVQCDCGNEKIVLSQSLRSGATASCGCARRLPPSVSGARKAFRELKYSAKKRGYSVEIDFEKFKEIVKQNCWYCNAKPSTKTACNGKAMTQAGIENSTFVRNGVDRFDNDKGYVEGNCVPCCEQCNKAKLDKKPEEFLEWLKDAYEHQKKLGNIK